LFKTLKDENKFLFLFHLEKPKTYIDTQKNEIIEESLHFIQQIFEHLILFRDLIPGDILTEFLTEKDNTKFLTYRKKYKVERHLFNKLFYNFTNKYFKKNKDSEDFPELLPLINQDKQKSKTYIPKLFSKYLERSESIVKRLKQQYNLLQTNLEKCVQNCFSISELYIELENQKKLLEEKTSKKLDNLRETLSSSVSMFKNIGK
jgi:hypothetical protein